MLLASIWFREDEIKYIWNSDLPWNDFLEWKWQFPSHSRCLKLCWIHDTLRLMHRVRVLGRNGVGGWMRPEPFPDPFPGLSPNTFLSLHTRSAQSRFCWSMFLHNTNPNTSAPNNQGLGVLLKTADKAETLQEGRSPEAGLHTPALQQGKALLVNFRKESLWSNVEQADTPPFQSILTATQATTHRPTRRH